MGYVGAPMVNANRIGRAGKGLAGMMQRYLAFIQVLSPDLC